MQKKSLTKVQKTKIAVIKPILDDWNGVVKDDWTIQAVTTYGHDTAIICSKSKMDNINGCVLNHIAGVIDAYGWTWAVYFTLERGMFIIL